MSNISLSFSVSMRAHVVNDKVVVVVIMVVVVVVVIVVPVVVL